MVDAIDTTNAYVKTQMAKLPEVERGEARVIKRGDCLWDIAKAEVKKQGKTSNAAISEYMLLIAKLNGFDTSEKMNGIEVNSTIYLPGQVKKTVDAGKTNPVNNPNPQTQKTEVSPKPSNAAEQSFANLAQKVISDDNLYVEQSNVRFYRGVTIYHVYTNTKINEAPLGKKLLLSFDVGADGKIEKLSFDNDNDINRYAYDYDVNEKGQIVTHTHPNTFKGKVDQAQFEALDAKLQSMINLR